MEFSVCSLSIQEPGSGTAGESRQPSKISQGSQALRPSQGSKSSSLDALGPARKEEEASFWKINAERSRGEGPEAEFQSLTPSQIKSMEKGEKVLPACYRQDPALKDREPKAERPSHLRQEQRGLPCVGIDERPQPVQACASTTPSEPEGKLSSPEAGRDDVEDVEDSLFSEPMPTQVGGPPSSGVTPEGVPTRWVGHRCGLFLPLPLLPPACSLGCSWDLESGVVAQLGD